MLARGQTVFGIALCCVLTCVGCSSVAGAPPSSPQAFDFVNAGTAAQRVAAYAIGASDYCPSKLGTSRLPFAAEDAQGKVIPGAFTNAIDVKDDDKLASRISATTIRGAGQKETITFLNNYLFQVTASLGTSSYEILKFAPGGECINPQPPILLLTIGGASRRVTLGGPKTGPHYELSSELLGAGCLDRATITRKTETTFEVAPGTTKAGECDIWAATQYGFFAKAIPVLFIKK
jgi:hypothetical protein